ncbi:hypothetical protein C8R46DRAFT_1354204 [Mycena filopes]|nr:hypothetical protein C8R46DRAFT_1354204 [Mycena filopes]
MDSRDKGLPPSSTASLRTALAEIDAELAALRARVEELAAARKPIITAAIFLLCVDVAEISDKSPCAPLVLASVCQQWRAVALHLEPIWSRLQIYDAFPFDGTTRLKALLAWWVPRAGGRLLEVDMMQCGGDVITALVPHSTRWRTLSCNLSSGWIYPTGLATIQGRIPRLEILRIKLAGGPMPADLLSIFSDAPLLREAHITSLALELFALPWEQLTTLGLAGQFPVPYTEILQRTPQLQTLHLKLGFDVLVSQTAVTLHHLHTLKLHGDRDDDEDEQENALLNALILPALRHLDLELSSGAEFLDEVIALLTRSSCPLASISLRSPTLYLQSAILDAVRTPTEIRLTSLAWTREQFNYFFRRMHGSLGTLPNLRTLSMSSRLVNVPYGAMAAMVASRQGSEEEGCTRLESFQFTFTQLSPVDDTVSAMFENASAHGCRVEIQGSNLGLNTDSGAAHSYTLDNPSRIF